MTVVPRYGAWKIKKMIELIIFFRSWLMGDLFGAYPQSFCEMVFMLIDSDLNFFQLVNQSLASGEAWIGSASQPQIESHSLLRA